MKKNKAKKKFEFSHADNLFAGIPVKSHRLKKGFNLQEPAKSPEKKSMD
ncbi:hypothetical protein SAMN04488057_10950 [Cyclobacterium lianum]|uniref:Uncharacterized protein n=1 Tax=Cyclobacterium lianum TaxID=388280 RepID=A0A1M7PJG3_9BACT|nr:hypothetical protein [Cyclobacterium lianum]SHN17278.1 hypothetical protein SAMN04488057_10950 [Cyclobacterium lianum]